MDAEEKPTNFLTQARDWKSEAVFGTVMGMLTGAAASGNINEGLVTGTCFGMYYGVHNWVAEKRGVVDLTNCIVAGAATGCTLAMMVAPPASSTIGRAGRAVYGSILGAVCFVPIGWLDLKLLEREKKQATRKNAIVKNV